MLTGFSFYDFRFHLEPKTPLYMPAWNKGNVIRGGFGSTFRRIVCHANCRDPETCELKSVCPYTAVFQPFVPNDSEKISKNRDIPRPFVIKPPLETKETYSVGERLSFDVVLIGKSKEYLPYFIVTFKELSQAGLGRHRSPVELCAVGHVGRDGIEVPVYTKENNLVQPAANAISWADLYAAYSCNNGAANVARVTLRFLTPTMLKADGLQARRPAFGPIAKLKVALMAGPAVVTLVANIFPMRRELKADKETTGDKATRSSSKHFPDEEELKDQLKEARSVQSLASVFAQNDTRASRSLFRHFKFPTQS